MDGEGKDYGVELIKHILTCVPVKVSLLSSFIEIDILWQLLIYN